MPTKKRSPNGSGNISRRKDGRYELKVFVDTPDGRRKRITSMAPPGTRPTQNALV